MAGFADVFREALAPSIAKSGVELRGMGRLMKQLDKLGKTSAKRVMRRALREGAKVSERAIKAAAPVDTGALRRSYRVRAAKRSRRFIAARVISLPVAGMERFYATMVEFGPSPKPRRRNKKRPRPKPRQPTAKERRNIGRVRRAFDTSEGPVRMRIATEIWQGIRREVARESRKQ